MKKVLFSIIAMFVAVIIFSGIYASSSITIENDEILAGTYVIGTHVFDRNANEVYDGTLTVRHIMLGATTISGETIEDMKVYYKRAIDEAWVNAITTNKEAMAQTVTITHYNTKPIDVAKSDLEAAIKKQLVSNGLEEGKITTADQFENVIEGTPGVTDVEKVAENAWEVSANVISVIIYQSGEAQGNIDVWDGVSTEVPEVKNGNWYINKGSELKFLADFVNNGGLTAKQKEMVNKTNYQENDFVIGSTTTVYLMSDLDLGAKQKDGVLTTGVQWTPIGNDDNKFLGVFDGNNHTITGLYIKQHDNRSGLFGYANEIKNLKVKDGYIESTIAYTGAIAGDANIIINCHNINTAVYQENNYAGGVVGIIHQKIENSTNSGSISGEKGYIGGLASYADYASSITNCTNTGNVLGIEENIGGIVGFADSRVKITKCVNNGEVNGKTKAYTAGIVGLIRYTGEVTYCVNNGVVKGREFTAGIVGRVLGNNNDESSIDGAYIAYCYNTSKISGKELVGGIAGDLDYYQSTIEKCYNVGIVEGYSEIGGIVGFAWRNAKIIDCYNTGKIMGEEYIGGIIGDVEKSTTNDIEINNVYNLGNVIGNETVGGLIGYTALTGITENACYLKGTASVDYGNKTSKTLDKTEEYIKTTFLTNANKKGTIWEIREGVNNGYPVLVDLK